MQDEKGERDVKFTEVYREDPVWNESTGDDVAWHWL